MSDSRFTSYDVERVAERWTSRVLRIGVWTSACLMILGLLMATLSPSSIESDSTNPSLGILAKHLFSTTVDPATLMFAGLVMLMLTPILRVGTAIIGFILERDWRFVVVSSIVLLMLAAEIVYSLFLRG
jgi:uncharacterized membrane protein